MLIVDDSPERSFCFSIYCLNKAILDFQDKYSLDTSVQLYDSTDLLKHLIGGMQYVSSDKQSYKTIESFSYQFTKQFMWRYYTRSMITEENQIKDEIKKLRNTAAENPLALSLTNVMQAILQKNTKELQDTVRTAKEKIQKIAHDYLIHSFRQAINRKRHK